MGEEPRKSMALKLERWLQHRNEVSLAKQTSGNIISTPSPLRPVVQTTTSSQRRVSGYLTALSMDNKSISRQISNTEDINRSNNDIIKSPLKSSLPTNTQEETHVESSSKENKENQSCHIKLKATNNVIKTQSRQSILHEIVESSNASSDIQSIADQNVQSTIATPVATHRIPLENKATTLKTNNSMQSPQAKEVEKVKSKESEGTYSAKAFWNEVNKQAVCQNELEAMIFLNSIQEQQINELVQKISKSRLDQNEDLVNRGKKHKHELKKIAKDRASYEERANEMISQMGEQMALLQSMAMSRIEVLENDLMAERHRVESLSQEAIGLKAALITATAAAVIVKNESSIVCSICESELPVNVISNRTKDLSDRRESVLFQYRNSRIGRSLSNTDSDHDCSSTDETVRASDDENEQYIQNENDEEKYNENYMENEDDGIHIVNDNKKEEDTTVEKIVENEKENKLDLDVTFQKIKENLENVNKEIINAENVEIVSIENCVMYE